MTPVAQVEKTVFLSEEQDGLLDSVSDIARMLLKGKRVLGKLRVTIQPSASCKSKIMHINHNTLRIYDPGLHCRECGARVTWKNEPNKKLRDKLISQINRYTTKHVAQPNFPNSPMQITLSQCRDCGEGIKVHSGRTFSDSCNCWF